MAANPEHAADAIKCRNMRPFLYWEQVTNWSVVDLRSISFGKNSTLSINDRILRLSTDSTQQVNALVLLDKRK